MSNLHNYLWLIPALPLFTAALITFLGPRFLRDRSHWPCILAVALSCLLSCFVLGAVNGLHRLPTHNEVERDPLDHVVDGSEPPPKYLYVEQYYTWAKVGDVNLGLTLRADGLTAIMLVTVTFVGTLIVIF